MFHDLLFELIALSYSRSFLPEQQLHNTSGLCNGWYFYNTNKLSSPFLCIKSFHCGIKGSKTASLYKKVCFIFQ